MRKSQLSIEHNWSLTVNKRQIAIFDFSSVYTFQNSVQSEIIAVTFVP